MPDKTAKTEETEEELPEAPSTGDLDTAVGEVEAEIDKILSLQPHPDNLAAFNAASNRLSAAATRLGAASGDAYRAATAAAGQEPPEATYETSDDDGKTWQDEDPAETAKKSKS